MKKFIFILSYSVYITLILGFILHTSAHPQIFGRYTVKYLIVLIVLIIGFIPFLWFVHFLQNSTTVRLKKKKITLTPRYKFLLLLVAIFILVFPIELYLRYKYKNYESNTYTYTIDNFNPFLQSQIAKQENLTVNSLGFRGEEISPIKPKGTYRIAVLGGSTVLNREVPFEKNAVRLLEKKLRNRFPDKKIEVINAGKDYYTSEHSLIQFMFKISDLNPDLVIMWHGANDMGASCLLEGVISYGQYKSDYSHLFGAVASIVFDHFRPQPIIQIKLVTFDFVVKTMEDNLFSDITNAYKNAYRTQAAKDYMENKNTVSVQDFPSLDAYKRNLLYMIELTKEKKIPLILGDQPSLMLKKVNSVDEVKAIMYPTIACRENGKYYDLNSLKYGLNLFNKETQTVAKDNQVMFIDLSSQVPPNLSYFLDSLHYTEKGDERIANSLYNYILSHQLIPGE